MVSLKYIISLLVFILLIHFFATVNHWYWTYSWFDIPMHFLGGFWVAMVYFMLRNQFQEVRPPVVAEGESPEGLIDHQYFGGRTSQILMIVSCLSFVALIGVLWEFFEFLYDVFISSRGYSGFMQLGAADMIGDLFFDLLGASIFLIIYKIFNRR